MDAETLGSALQTATRQVLEEATFVFSEPTSEPFGGSSWPGTLVRVRLGFSGPLSGHFMLVASSELCQSLAADMLGESDTEALAGEVLGEILNMATGIALTELLGSDSSWALRVPEAEQLSAAEFLAAPAPDVWVRLLTEEEQLIVGGVFIEQGAQ